jgi:hypothetical protein
LHLVRPNCLLAPPLAPACEPTGLGLLLLTHRWTTLLWTGRDPTPPHPVALEPEMLGSLFRLNGARCCVCCSYVKKLMVGSWPGRGGRRVGAARRGGRGVV